MENNFRTLISAILAKVSSIYVKKEEVEKLINGAIEREY